MWTSEKDVLVAVEEVSVERGDAGGDGSVINCVLLRGEREDA